MPEMKVDCPRCAVKAVTADMGACTITHWDFGGNAISWEASGVCRRCEKSAIYKLRRRSDNDARNAIAQCRGNLHQYPGHWDNLVECVGHINLVDNAMPEVPEHLPDLVGAAFREALICMSVGCANAAGAMFRLSLDLSTKALLDQVVQDSGEAAPRLAVDRLADRITWLIDKRHVPARLKGFAHEVRLSGNDGAHDGSLSIADVQDLYDFSDAYLREMHTAPGQLAEVEARRKARREAR